MISASQEKRALQCQWKKTNQTAVLQLAQSIDAHIDGAPKRDIHCGITAGLTHRENQSNSSQKDPVFH